MVSDEALMLDFQRGSRESLEELFARYRQPLYAFFRRRLNSAERAEDLTQETFLSVIRAIARYEPRSRVKTYLYGIALNLLAAERRKKNKSISQRDLEPFASDLPDSRLWLSEAVGKLDSSEREILMLREYEQLSYAEIADLLRVPLNTVRSRLFRARMALKTLLEPTSQVSPVGR